MKNRTKLQDKLLRLIFLTIMLMLIAMSTSSCAGVKKFTNKETTSIDKTEVKKDTTSKVQTNGKIKDNIVINVPESADKKTNEALIELMNKMNMSKSSGSNGYKSTFDKETMQWAIEFIVAETNNKSLETNSDIKTDKSFEQNIDEYVKKIVVPWWMYILGGLLAWRLFGPILLPIINPILGVLKSSISQL